MGAQLSRLLKCDRRSDLEPIVSFKDWAESWAVYARVICKHHPNRLQDLIAYFLFIAKTSSKSAGLGWIDYDRAFRKKAAGVSGLSWASPDTPLYLATVLSRGGSARAARSAESNKPTSSS